MKIQGLQHAVLPVALSILVWILPTVLWADEFRSDEVDQLIIKYHADVQQRMAGKGADSMAQAAERSVSAATGLRFSYKRPMAQKTGAHVLRLPYVMSVSQAQLYAQQIMAQQADIEYAEPDYRRYPLRTVPNDPNFNQQWHLLAPTEHPGAMNAVNAWSITKGSRNIVVAVLDEGITNHTDLQPSLVGGAAATSGYDMVSRDESGDGDGRDADPSNPGASAAATTDSVWHGTHVGGVIAARPDNGEFVAGVGWNTRLLVVRVLSETGGTLSDQVDGMLWAGGESVPDTPKNMNPAQIINLSVGTDFFETCARTEQSAVDVLRQKGVAVVVSAGNENRNVEGSAPANCKGVLAVSGVTADGARAPFANYGELNTIAAPAVDIFSTINSGKRQPENDAAKADSGTSQAAPQVAGVLALMLAANKNLLDEAVIPKAKRIDVLEDKLKRSARRFPVAAAIMGSADPQGCNNNQEIACLCTKQTCGAGLLDAFRAIKAVADKPVAKTGENREVAGSAVVNLDGSGSTDDKHGHITTYRWEQLSGDKVALSDPNQAVVTLTAPPAIKTDRVLVFKLTVTDDVGLQSDSTVEITVAGTGSGTDAPANNSGGGGSMPLYCLLSLLCLLGFRRFQPPGR